MHTEYSQAVRLWIALNRVLDALPVWDMDSPELQAREDLAYWIALYRMGQATYIDWIFATQNALDVILDGPGVDYRNAA